ncbi:MotE family protein [Pseudoruegeria sp. HB172150]|uniref:MotE family protein n=1 Tax=Pseudoruegeria sp. HB172150 TaxID=2721164 RepID=UPI0015539BA7|nr:hypothetical protein [Pseudoruegeria sp. HB172150]
MTKAARKTRKAPSKRKARRRSGRGVLWLLIAMLTASGAARLASGTGQVLAEEIANLTSEEGHAMPASDDLAECEPAPDVAALLEAFAQREARLVERETALADRTAALNLAEQEIEKNLSALEKAEANLAELVTISDQAAEGDLARLTAVYEQMKPKEAAALFEEMAPEFAAGFLGRMRSDAAAAIMAGLEPGTANTVSVLLAGRNANAPTE